jgi:hypothetical protein
MSTLDNGIYQVHQNPQTGELYFVRVADEFHFGFKLYGVDETLITHVIDTYNKQPTKKNLGVLLNGAKGTGKTVTAKLLANKLGLPVVLCEKPYPGLDRLLAGINHDCIFLFDEFEKNFRLKCDDDEDCAGEDLLSIMDGVYNSNHCHVFIMTTNKLRVNDNLISRPSRIRYIKSFGEVIDRKILEEFVDDNLLYKEYKEEIMEFIDTLTMATIDIVKSIVEEVNLHHCSVDTFKSFFNVKEASYRYFVRAWNYEIDDKEAPDMKSFLAACNAAYGTGEFKPRYDSLLLNRSIKKYKVGDMLTYRYKITNIDLENGYVNTVDNTYPNNKCHFFFENINTTPNLYNDNAYGYCDDEW